MFRQVSDADYSRIVECIVAMGRAKSLEDAAHALIDAAMDLVACDHGGYAEIDLHFGRTKHFASEPEVEEWVERRASTWRHFMPNHPVLKFRNDNPHSSVVRLSDVADMSDFYQSGIYAELFREVETNHQLVMHLGFDPKEGFSTGALPLTLGVPLNRKGRDFTSRDMDVLSMLQTAARPALRRKRAEHQLRLLDAAVLTPDLKRSLMGLGLSGRLAEVAFWMLKGKSNPDVGEILDIGAQTVRQHSIAIYRTLGITGRLSLQRKVIRTITDFN
ncbi:MAG: helix-turn-helix transcriptional regulator [Pseudomonadota bacterium]